MKSMTRLPFKVSYLLFLAFLIFSCAAPEEEAPGEYPSKLLAGAELGDYSHGIAVGDMHFLWTPREDSLDIKLEAPTKGWVSIGFNPETGRTMKGANLILGFVRAGKAEVVDHYGTMKDKHKDDDKIGGQTNISNVSGSEVNGKTEIAFTIPLDSADAKDAALSLDGDSIVLMAYGKSDRIVLKHKFRAILSLNLSSGEHRVLPKQ
jgi:hypothetical protein